MSRKITTEDFISMSRKIHGTVYNYSKSNYVKSLLKTEIICSKHGSFFQRPNSHLNGAGCPKCSTEKTHERQRLTIEEVIRRSQKVHKNKYDYSRALYKGWDVKIILGCPTHGFFEQRAGDHLMGEGCQKCARRYVGDIEKISLDDFILRSNNIHDNKYNYLKTTYKNNRTKITITCSQHGDFFVTPNNHLKGYGCPKCQKEAIFSRYREKFVKRATATHSGFYDYSKTIILGHKKKIKIICPKHGPFYQLINSHLTGDGCPKCILKKETALEEIIRENFITWKIKRHKRFYSREHGRYRYFDFFISKESKKIIIEYDGLQHFKAVRFSSKMTQDDAEKKFEKQKITDQADKSFCERKGIDLYRISYRENMESRIKEILSRIN